MDIIDRLKNSGEATVRATALIAEAKSERNRAAGDEGATYDGLKFEETMEAKAIAEIQRLRLFVSFVNLWCWRDSKITDAERLSMIKFHPTARAAAHGAPSEAAGKGQDL